MKNFTLLFTFLFSLTAFGQTQIDLPIDWEGSTTNYTVQDFGGNASQLVADPMNASNTVLESVKGNTAQLWAGTSLCDVTGLATAIPFTMTDNLITVYVYSPDAGIPVRLKAEDNSDPTKSVETEAVTTVANAWDTLVFDFSNEAPGTAVINYTYTYNKLSIFYNFGTDGANAGTKTYYCDEVFFGGNTPPPPASYNVTFQVDMNDYTGTFTTPEVNGLFNGWCGNCIPLTDANTDGIWEVTVPIMDDSTEYKFSYDNWTGQEALTPGSSCTKTTGANTNRFIVLTGDTVLPPVCWESCAPCTGVPASADVTFKVDLSDYTGSYTEVNLNGTFNNWCGSCAKMTSPNGDDIYEITVTVPTDSIEFKYTLDGWTTEEMLTEGLPCTKTTVDGGGTFTNRFLVPTADTTLDAVCWESCEACGTVGIEENNWVSDFSISPNPTNDIVNIRATLNGVDEYTIVILDLQGRMLFEKTIKGQTINESIDMSFAESGMYILNIVGQENVLSKRIMIVE